MPRTSPRLAEKAQEAPKEDTVKEDTVIVRSVRPLPKNNLANLLRQEQLRIAAIVFEDEYKVVGRSLQIEAVVKLLNKEPTFLLAGTGYGKSRIPELFYHLYSLDSKPIILVLIPLDALGADQVSLCLSLVFSMGFR